MKSWERRFVIPGQGDHLLNTVS
ncbi:uncharacterized protein METZ01_LOCUS132997 [marine metagenome]|uniref:Uncharacterized protein n=1 Tax=marine metagenome TaxID=408172 RepID=A0A381YUB4_9ZZZZ